MFIEFHPKLDCQTADSKYRHIYTHCSVKHMNCVVSAAGVCFENITSMKLNQQSILIML